MSGVTLANGVTVTADMSPEARHNAVAESLNLPTVAAPTAPGMGPSMRWDTNTARVVGETPAPPAAPGTIGNKPAPPDPKALEASRRAELATIEADVASRHGKPTAPAQPDIGQPNQPYMAELTTLYRETPEKRRTPEWVARWQAEYSEAMTGRLRGESRPDFLARTAQAAPAADPKAISAAVDKAAKASDKDGFAPASAIGSELLHGYRIPQDRAYNVAELVAGLRLARAGNLTQQQVNAIIQGG